MTLHEYSTSSCRVAPHVIAISGNVPLLSAYDYAGHHKLLLPWCCSWEARVVSHCLHMSRTEVNMISRPLYTRTTTAFLQNVLFNHYTILTNDINFNMRQYLCMIMISELPTWFMNLAGLHLVSMVTETSFTIWSLLYITHPQ